MLLATINEMPPVSVATILCLGAVTGYIFAATRYRRRLKGINVLIWAIEGERDEAKNANLALQNQRDQAVEWAQRANGHLSKCGLLASRLSAEIDGVQK